MAVGELGDDTALFIGLVTGGREGRAGLRWRAVTLFVAFTVQPSVRLWPDGEEIQRHHQCDAEHRGEAVQTGAG